MNKHDIKKLEEKYFYYKNNVDEYSNIREKVKQQLLSKKTPSQKPIAYIVMSQTGGGKSSLKNFILKKIENVVQSDSDDCKVFLPYCEEIMKNYPELYNTLTRGDAYALEDDILKSAIEQNYNIVIESTGKVNLWDKLINSGYNIKVFILATSKCNSEFSILDRYVNQTLNIDIKYPKLTEFSRHENSFYNVREFVKEHQNMSKINIQVYVRGKSNSSDLPIIYGKCNNKYSCPYEALLAGQDTDEINFKQKFSLNSDLLKKKIEQAKAKIPHKVLEELYERLNKIVI
ncbi:MAG: zeta toxin family protein [Clostridia bacterium]|nr:zeta toxin family protein [Clostridia bacterium]MDD4386943.1 zeta toxin family protein [Clostridia bacterium]